jgi:ATP-dependent DNA ligase
MTQATIKPMLLTEIEQEKGVFEKYKDWIFQEKQNGDRAIISIQQGKITSIRNRSDSPLLHLFPELKELTFEGINSAIVDSEVCVFIDGKSVFYGGINQRDKKLHDEKVKDYPITIVGFDLIYFDGKLLVGEAYAKRYDILKQMFKDNKHFKVAENISNPKEYWDRIIVENREGFVIKNPKARYEMGVRSKEYLKYKNYKRVEVKVEQIEGNPKGTKIYSTATINNNVVKVECQVGGNFDIKVGDTIKVEYLDIVGDKLIQPHKISNAKGQSEVEA